MAKSSIEWTQMTWNPTTGCDKLSAGCKYCYAEEMTRRLMAMGQENTEKDLISECMNLHLTFLILGANHKLFLSIQ